MSQPGNAQCRSRVMTARRRPPVIRLVGVPVSSGRLTDGDLVPGEAGAQERGQPARPGQKVGGVAEQGLVQPGQRGRGWRLRGVAGAGGAEFGGQGSERGLVHGAGDDRGDGRVARIRLGGPAGQPARLPLGRGPCGFGAPGRFPSRTGVAGGWGGRARLAVVGWAAAPACAGSPGGFRVGGAGQVTELL